MRSGSARLAREMLLTTPATEEEEESEAGPTN
jgi:hypothetical protein